VRNLKAEAPAMTAVPRVDHALAQMGQANLKPANAAATLSPAQKLKRITLEKEVQFLEEQYTAVSKQLLYENNKATQVALEGQAKELLENYEKKQMQLRQLT
jgi:Effector-associated domain 9